MDYNAITLSYYEKWLGQPGCLTDSDEIQFIYTNERKIQQKGYSFCLNLYCWFQPNKIVVSYGNAVKNKIGEFKEMLTINNDISEISKIISNVFGYAVKHNIKYLYKGTHHRVRSKAKILTMSDYADYEQFFLNCFPGDDNEWLREYFDEMVKFGCCVGVYVDDKIVSCTDAPSMPYMEDKVQEIGINTLSEYRGKGYAAIACVNAAENIIAGGKVPQWSTGDKNIASQKLAERTGFVKIADVLTLRGEK